jgi:hypothetical protein
MAATHLTRFTSALLVAGVLVALTATAALGGSGGAAPPDWLERQVAKTRQAAVLDARSPDTRDAAASGGSAGAANAGGSLQPAAAVASDGSPTAFDWQDAGVGAASALAAVLLAGGTIGLVARSHRRHRVEAAPVEVA